MGSGLRPFGQAAIARHGPASPQTYHVFVSHVHWDHIMGLPFFTPAYIPGNRVRFYGGHAELEAALRRQQEVPSFPVDFSALGRRSSFRSRPTSITRWLMTVTPAQQMHSGDSFGYRFEALGKTFVYTTDSEHKLENRSQTERFVRFFQGADLVVFDAMYSLADAISVKADWGALEQHRRRRAVPARARAPALPVPPRAGARR
jgi:phosphoribosyl 1,2-cyclic phosphodiesterase